MPRIEGIKKVMIIGSGPIVIGQACEFDYSGTQACKALRKLGYEIVLANSNPATIMTDPGTADVTYIEPLNVQAMTEIIKKERPDALLPNLGGQSGLNLSSELAKAGVLEQYGVQVIGVNIDAIERGEDRIAFKDTMNHLGIEMPKSDPALSVEEAEKIAAELGYPVVIRPAYTMGGTGGGLVYNLEELRTVAARGLSASLVNQILVEESVLGGGPNRIGQGIEFDYCCVHAAFTLRDEGFESIMVNCNPETVSTDYDTSDKLYFEPLTIEDVLSIYEKEKPLGVVVQFGGQTPLNIANELAEAGVPILGTTPDTIDLAEDRDRFRKVMRKLGIPQAESGMASSCDEALEIAKKIGYPLMVRPSYVLGGRGMEVVHDEEMLREYVAKAVEVTPDRPILIDKFLENAIEAEADAIADGNDAFVPAVMEHIELAGVHSGDSACVIPPTSIPEKHLQTIYEYTRNIAIELKVVGLMNIQYAIANDTVYILEANPRASRTVPLVSKVCGISMARIATQLMLGKKLADLKLERKAIPHFGVKESVFPFDMFPEVDPLLGPEMRSTGEVLGMADSFGLAFYKAQEAAKQYLPCEGGVLITVTDKDKGEALDIAREFEKIGFTIYATDGTQEYFSQHGVTSEKILKMFEGRPGIVDEIKNQKIQLVINTPIGKLSKYDDSYIRKSAIKYKIPYITTMAAARATVKGIQARRDRDRFVKSLQEYHADIH